MSRPQDITSIERERRIQEVKKLTLEGFTRSQIIRYCSDKYNIGTRCTEGYITDVKLQLLEDFNSLGAKEEITAQIFSRLEDLYQKNVDIDDYKECRAILKDLREMLGIAQPTKLDVTTNGEKIQSNIIQVEIIRPNEE